MVLAKFLCQAMACNFVILEKKIHKEKKNEIEWLEEVDEAFKSDLVCRSWAQHHSQMNRCESSPVGINAILPLITKEVHTIETQYHCMTTIKNTISKLNQSQTPIDVCDQCMLFRKKSKLDSIILAMGSILYYLVH